MRGLCQNDAHIYIRPDQAKEEVIRVLKLHEECYLDLGLKGYRYRLSKHDPQSNDFLGEKELWIHCEQILREALEELKLDYFEAEGEAAFYGPKIDVQMKFFSDEGVREESMGSVQIDFVAGKKERFNLRYDNQEGGESEVWIIHRAPLGSHERFVAMLLEYYDGQLPRFLSPIELIIFPLSEVALEKARELERELKNKSIRVKVDHRHHLSLSKKLHLKRQLRPHAHMVIGDKEISSGLYNVEDRSKGVSKLESWIGFS